jgi:hypothetical protein
MSQILVDAKAIYDLNNDPVCILPAGFRLTDERWDQIWSLHDKLDRFNSHLELSELFPDDESLKAGFRAHSGNETTL